MDVEPDFRPFAAEDDGRQLVLRRARTASDLLLRGCLYLLLLLLLAMLVLIPVAAWSRAPMVGAVKSIVGVAVLMPLTWLGLKLMLWAFHLEGVTRLECAADGLHLVRRGAVRRSHEHVRDVVALEARTFRTPTKYRDVRWLRLAVRTAAGKTDLGYLALHPEAEPTREAAVRAAAGRIAARLQVPLELYDEAGERVPAA